MDHKAYLAQVPPELRTTLTAREDWAGLVHLALHVGAIALIGTLIALKIPFWPLLLPLQGVLLVFLFTLAHECTHQTPFRTTWLNEVVGHVCGFILFMPFKWFRPFHLAHHRWTNLPGRDPELDRPKPTTMTGWLWHISGIPIWIALLRLLPRLAMRRDNAPYLSERAKDAARVEACIYIGLYSLAALSLVLTPVLLWVWIIPMIISQPALRLYLLAEHGDCPQVTDMFANTRTVFTTRLMRFLAWNMPYHTEHHVWPQVPFHALPALHRDMQAQLTNTANGYAAFNREYLARLQTGQEAATPATTQKKDQP